MMRYLLSLLLALCLWYSPMALQAQCGSPDTNCDELVNVEDLLGLLSYFGIMEGGNWAEDCSSPDVNCDGIVNVEDLLGLLSYFGQTDADSDGIWDSEDDCVCALAGCTDNSACNYDPQATEDDGSCLEEFGWAQIGLDIDGEAAVDGSGWSVSLSADGSIVAIGAPFNDAENGPSSTGHVRVYAWDGGSWVQRGLDIDGEAAWNVSGGSVSLSADGSIVAIGATGVQNDEGSGHVRVFEWDGSSWIQRGLNIDGEADGDGSGHSVSLSSDGSIVAIGAPSNDGNGEGSGHVRVFAWDGSSWTQRGMDIDGDTENERSGGSVSLSNDGNIVAIGAPGGDGPSNGNSRVRVYAWDGSTWVQRGGDLEAEEVGESGGTVSLSADGSIVAIGTYNNPYWGINANNGYVRVFEWDGSSWVQRGTDIVGEAENDASGWSVSLSSDGSIVAIGAPFNDANGEGSGHVRVFEWDGSSWVQRGVDIDGESGDINTGWRVSLSADGSIVASSAPFNFGSIAQSGQVRVYGYSCEVVEGCTNSMAENFNPTANVDDGSCIIPGCLFEVACNYNPEATTDDGSCIFICPGCTDPAACNYDNGALQEDGSCEFLSCAGCTYEFACNYDPDATIPDNDSCEFGSCPGCTDPEALNYNPAVTEDDGSCEYPAGFNTCSDPVSYQGYDYATVLIGDQCWFAENLRSENYENGDAIPAGLSDSEWTSTTSGATAVYGEGAGCENYSPDINACDPAQSLNEYGRLYNWYAVDDERGLCPSGWQVPTDGEWTVMTDFLGGEDVAGGQMKTTYGWNGGGNGTNSSGFSGLPGGGRSNSGYFYNAGYDGGWWSSSPSGSSAWSRNLDSL